MAALFRFAALFCDLLYIASVQIRGTFEEGPAPRPESKPHNASPNHSRAFLWLLITDDAGICLHRNTEMIGLHKRVIPRIHHRLIRFDMESPINTLRYGLSPDHLPVTLRPYFCDLHLEMLALQNRCPHSGAINPRALSQRLGNSRTPRF